MGGVLRLNVGTRLGWGFAVVIVLGVLIAVIADMRLKQAAESTHDLIDNRVLKKDQMSYIKDQLNIQAQAMRNIILTTDQEEREIERNRVVHAQAANNELVDALAASLDSELEERLLNNIRSNKDEYVKGTDQIIELAMNRINESARLELMSNDFRAVQRAYFNSLDELALLQDRLMLQAADDLEEAAHTTRMLMIAITIFAVLVSALIAYLITRSILRQLGGEPDEAARIVREIATGNLSVAIRLRRNDQHSLMANMVAMQQSLIALVGRVRQDSEHVAAASTQIADASLDLGGRTSEQASAIQETAASMEQLSVTVEQNTDNAHQADELAKSAAEVTVRAGELVSGVVQTMDEIDDASQKVSEIINVIDGIAFQTNILALNAAVEAARAGEQGRGFAVVATEVRALAQRSATAAQEIQELSNESLARVHEGNRQVADAGTTMQEVVHSINRVAQIMAEIAAAGREQNVGVSQVGVAVTQMDEATQQNASLVEEMSAAAATLNEQAANLVETVSIFNTEDAIAHRSAADYVDGETDYLDNNEASYREQDKVDYYEDSSADSHAEFIDSFDDDAAFAASRNKTKDSSRPALLE